MSEGFTFRGETYEYATFGRRLGAAALDSVFFFVGAPLLLAWSGALEGIEPEGLGVLMLALFAALFVYFQVCEWRFGQTMAKNALGLRVMSTDGENPSVNAAAARNAMRFVDGPLALVGVTYLAVERSARRQRLGDRAAGTIVVRVPEPETARPEPAAPAPTAADLFPDATGTLAAVAGGPPAGPAGPARVPAAPPAPAPPPGPEPASRARHLPYADWPVRRTVQGVLLGILLGGLLLPIPVLIADPELETHAGLIGAQAVLGLTLIAASLVVAGAGERGLGPALSRLGLRRIRPSALGWAALAYFAYLVLIAIYAAFVVQPDQEDIARDLGLDASAVTAALSVLLIAFIAPVSEELFFRGLLYGGLRVRLGPLVAAALSGLVFGGLHATTGITTVPPLVILGIALALLYEKTGSLWPPILVHFVNNSIALAVSA